MTLFPNLINAGTAFVFALGATTALPVSADAVEMSHRGIALQAIAPLDGQTFDPAPMAQKAGLERIAKAIDMIYSKSVASAAKIEALKYHGKVRIIYYPNDKRSGSRLNNQSIAFFAPGFVPKGVDAPRPSERFVMVINHMGIKWPTKELAAVIVHELAGHGRQHLHNRIASGGVLDLECEASLYEERAYQDFGVDKSRRDMVLFRKQLENRYCADFRSYMQRRVPNKTALWESVNPDVKSLLRLFRGYFRHQVAQRSISMKPAGGTIR